jgi:glycosyltransferase involved in cell wall biosynthesis
VNVEAAERPRDDRHVGAVPHVAFVMEQHLGHRTFAENLRSALGERPDVRTTWIPVNYAPSDAWWERVPAEGLRAALRGRREASAVDRATDADVVVFNTQVPAVLGGRTVRRRPFVLCTDCTPKLQDEMADGYGHHVDRLGAVRWMKDRWNGRVLRSAAAVAPWSRWVRRSLIDDYGVDPARIEVIPPGIDLAEWEPADRPTDGPMKILFVGGDFQRKGGELLLEAFGALAVGQAELRLVTRSPVTPRPGITVFNELSPNDPALKDLYLTSDVFVLPSRWEMFGIAAIEAAAAGLPALVTSVGGLADVVVDGLTGFSLEPNDRARLVHCLETLLHDPDRRRRMGRAARARAESEYDARTNADRLIRLALRCRTGGSSAAPTS